MQRTTIAIAVGILLFATACNEPQSDSRAVITSDRSQQTKPPTTAKSLEISEENEQLLYELGNFPDLEVLSIHCLDKVRAIPDSIGKLVRLKELNMDGGNGCAMNPQLPESIGNIESLQKLVLFGAQAPSDTFAHPSDRHPFPRGMSNLRNLVWLDLGHNEIDEIPLFVKDLPKLQTLGFGWNMKLKTIPAFLTNLRELRNLDLEADGLTDLPDFLNKLPKLTHIALGNNCQITQNQAKMKSLKRRFPKITFDFTDEYDC